MDGWTYSSHVNPDRVARLMAVPRFESVVEFVAGASIRKYVWEGATSERLRGMSRASFLLEVTPNEYDAFFNSPVGYRAQYAVSKGAGEEGNRRLIEALEPRLMAYTAENGEPNPARVSISLHGAGAKIWILENEIEEQMGADDHAILYTPWESHDETDAGLFAPVGTKLEVKGGWLNGQGVEHRDPIKANRSKEIHESGWT